MRISSAAPPDNISLMSCLYMKSCFEVFFPLKVAPLVLDTLKDVVARRQTQRPHYPSLH